ncbi:alpha/beta fold hydrolase [Achromobacter xylosoxidans]|uniref:alpha/beta fold hydrolase n=1 Tax=Alcaligenes xylosoxydans xylosoxydans TaxID=85698 RepID=UPI0038FCBB5E
MPSYSTIHTPLLEIAYLEWNPAGRRSAVLLHGWPDSPAGWGPVAQCLAAEGYRVLCPALRGFGPTRFLDPATPRSGELAALGRDLLDFIAALGLEQPLLVGHDWGARAAANACGLEAGDLAYAQDGARLTPAPRLAVPTLVLHGGADTCNQPATSEGKAHYFSGRYERRVLDGVGHFPQREAPQAVAAAILNFVAAPAAPG